MSRTGNCYDNAVTERFFWSLKHEWTKHEQFADLEVGSAECVQVHRNLLQSRAAPPDARLQITRTVRSRKRPGPSGVKHLPAAVRKSWAIARPDNGRLTPPGVNTVPLRTPPSESDDQSWVAVSDNTDEH